MINDQVRCPEKESKMLKYIYIFASKKTLSKKMVERHCICILRTLYNARSNYSKMVHNFHTTTPRKVFSKKNIFK